MFSNTKLKIHLNFIHGVLKKVKNTSMEKDWRKLEDLVLSEKKLDKTDIDVIDNLIRVQVSTMKKYAEEAQKQSTEKIPAEIEKEKLVVEEIEDLPIRDDNVPKINLHSNKKMSGTKEKSATVKIRQSKGKSNLKHAAVRPKILLRIKFSDIHKQKQKKRREKEKARIKKHEAEKPSIPEKILLGVSTEQVLNARENLDLESNIIESSAKLTPIDFNQNENPETECQPKQNIQASNQLKQPSMPLKSLQIEASKKKSSNDNLQLEVPEPKKSRIEDLPNANAETTFAVIDESLNLLVEVHSPKPRPRANISYFKQFNLKSCHVPVFKLLPPIKIKKEQEDSTQNEAAQKSATRTFESFYYTIVKNLLAYHCRSCSFTSKNRHEFRVHWRSMQHQSAWNGFCNICRSKEHTSKSITEELNHAYNEHVLKETEPISNLEVRKESSSTKKSRTTPMVSIPNEFLLHQNVLLDPASTLKRLRPWLSPSNATHQKFESMCTKMMHVDCLSALYKCMKIDCCFYTSSKVIFVKHMNLHVEKAMQPNEIENFLACAYCDFKGKLVQELADHVNNEHESGKYQCSYCFYRSTEFFISTHHKQWHAAKEKCFIKVKGVPKSLDKVQSREAGLKYVPEITCVVCKMKFYYFNRYEHHLKNDHKNVPRTQCAKCKIETAQPELVHHLKNCHGFGILHCAYCRFGTDHKTTLLKHLTNNHPFEGGFFFDRSNRDIPAGLSPFLPAKTPSLKRFKTEDLSVLDVIHSKPSRVLENAKLVNKLNYVNPNVCS